jgi:hypothetical protein
LTIPTMMTDIAFGKREQTEGNFKLAEVELNENTLRIKEEYIVGERTTLL